MKAGGRKRQITGAKDQRVNELRLSDIAKMIDGEHGGPCNDPEAARRYFFGALPHLISSRPKLIAFKGDIHAAVDAWMIEWMPLFWLAQGPDWITAQVDKCAAKARRWPSNDRLARTLQTTQAMVEKHGLCTLVAVERPKAIRKAERSTKAVERSQKNRAKVEGYKPRAETKAAQIRAAGGNLNTEKSRKRRARLAAEKATLDTAVHPNSFAGLGATHTGSFATVPVGPCTPVRSQHHSYTGAPCNHLSVNDLVLLAAEAETNAAERSAYIDATRASTVYGNQPIPDDEQHDRNMRSLVDGLEIAMAAYLDLDTAWQIAFREDDQERAHHRRAA